LPVTVARLIAVIAAASFLAGAVFAPVASGATDTSQAQSASKTRKPVKGLKADKGRTNKAAKSEKHGKPEKAARAEKKTAKPEKAGKAEKADRSTKTAKRKETRPRESAERKRPGAVPLPLPAPIISRATPTPPPFPHVRRTAPGRPVIPLAIAASGMASPLDLTAVKQAVGLVHKDRFDEATNVERTISDPTARKLVEWVILRSDDGDVEFSRYAAFIAANPTWPGIITLRWHAEAALWEQQVDPQTTLDYFAKEPPLSAKGYFALARAALVRGDSARAYAAVSTAWRNTAFSEEVEAQARQMFAGLITPADDKARMDARFYVGDTEAAMRAAHHLDADEFAIARARAAVIEKSSNAQALLAAVPREAQHDPGYMFSLIQYLRHHDQIKEATQWMLATPRDPQALVNPDQWWIERRLIARKLLDLGDNRTAYEIADEAAPPPNDNYRAEQQFTAGWIALEFLHQPELALGHFARIADGEVNPITLARSYYWQGRAAQALGRAQDARAYYGTAARYPTAYYGQIARAQLHLDDVALHEPPLPIEHRPLEMARVFEILYAIDERDIIAGMAADLADKTTDVAGLAELAEITVRHNDARATLLIGKTALGRGFPFTRYAFPDFGVPDYRQIGPAVERCVVYAIVRQESAFNAKVVSSAHAFGLMQVTPAAGLNTARKFKVPFDQHRLLNDVAYNAQLGTAELGEDIVAFRGSYILAFVAYNAGPRRAEEWIEQYGDPRNPKVDPIDWIERIPITETRYYVQRVLENMQVYRARLENNPQLLIEADLHRGA
jgi:soluble lytic murein transglycosylase